VNAPALVALGLGIAIGLVIAALLALVYFQIWKSRFTRTLRLDAVQRSQAVTVGKVTEQLIPYFPDFEWNPKDARFLGSPVDFLVFDGLADGNVRQVMFVEVKTAGGSLSPRERQVREAIQAGRVAWTELRIERKDSRAAPLRALGLEGE